ncbi:MAG: hypothetical protein K8W52_32905 [Deltaproteobacteria bacterium]|nr:hypothetical protein [Deltaproteobacteria bacterium]
MGRQLALVAAVVLGAAAPARADELLDLGRHAIGVWSPSQEAAISARLDAIEQQARDAEMLLDLLLQTDPIERFVIDASASVAGGVEGARPVGEVSARIDAHADNAGCQAVWANAMVRGRSGAGDGDRATLSGEGTAGICFPDGIDLSAEAEVPVSIFPLRLEVFGAIDKTPSRAAARAILREPYSEGGFRVSTEGMRWAWGDLRHWVAAPGVTIDQRWQWRGFPSGDPARLDVGLDLWFVRLHHRREPRALADRSIDVFAIHGHGVRDDNGAAIIDFWPLRVSGFGFGSDRVLVDAAVGVSGTGTIGSDKDVIMTTGLPQVTIAGVHAAVLVGERAQSLAVGFDRAADTNALAEVTAENRVWVRGHRERRGLWIDVGLYYSQARHYLDATTRGDEQVIGGTADAQIGLGNQLALGLSLEAALPLARDPVLADRGDGVRALVTMSGTYAIWHEQVAPIRSVRPGVTPFGPPVGTGSPAPPTP